MPLPDLAGEQVHLVKMLIPVARPGQVHLSARLHYHAGQVRWNAYKVCCTVLFVMFLHSGEQNLEGGERGGGSKAPLAP